MSSIFVLYLDDRKNLITKRLFVLIIFIYFICVNDNVSIIESFKFFFKKFNKF